MGQKMIRLDDEVYTELKLRADVQGRSCANLVNYYLRKEFRFLPWQDNGKPLPNQLPLLDDILNAPEQPEQINRGAQMQGILGNIRQLERDIQQELEFNQDDETREANIANAESLKSELWATYHELKEVEDDGDDR